jgi:hypothetical protein
MQPAVAIRSHPNPFNPRTAIVFDLPRAGAVHLSVYDVSGHRVRTLLRGAPIAAGRHELAWDGRHDGGRRLAGGVYYCRLVSGADRATLRLVLVD